MKIRMGFVSNSSSSSFCIYGKYFDNDEVLDLAKRILPSDKLNEFLDENEEFEGSYYELCEEIGSVLKICSYHYAGEDEGKYFGCYWSDIGDDETGRQFKEKIEKELGEGCRTHDVEYYS